MVLVAEVCDIYQDLLVALEEEGGLVLLEDDHDELVEEDILGHSNPYLLDWLEDYPRFHRYMDALMASQPRKDIQSMVERTSFDGNAENHHSFPAGLDLDDEISAHEI